MKMFRLLFITLALLIPPPALAQSQSDVAAGSPDLGWVTFELGYAGAKGMNPLGGGVSGSYLSKIGLLSIRFLGAGGSAIYPANLPTNHPMSVVELSTLYGMAHHTPTFLLSASSGVGVVWVLEYEPSRNHKSATIGIPLEAQAVFTPLNFLGIGMKAFGNINRTLSYGGIFFGLQLGKVK